MVDNYNFFIEGYPSRISDDSIFVDAINLMGEQRSALIEDEWKKFEDLGNLGIGQAYGRYRELKRSLTESDNSKALNADFIELLKMKSTDIENREEFFSDMKGEMLRRDPNTDPLILDALTKMSQGEEGEEVLNLIKSVDNSFSYAGKYTLAIDGTVSLAVRSLMALTYSNFHFHNEFLKDSQLVGPHKEEFLELLYIPVNTFQYELDKRMKQIYQHLVSGLSPVTASEELAEYVEESLPKLGRIQATTRLYAIALKEAGKGTLSEKAGTLCVIAGDLTRQAFAALASAYYLSMESMLETPSTNVKNILKKSSSLAYDTGFPNGKNIQISKIDQVSDGEYIEVSGFITSIDALREGADSKLISRITLFDPSSNTSVIAIGVFVNFRHIGLLEDTYCNLSGTWQSTSNINNNNPAIEIDKLAINEFSKTSWAVSFLDLSDKFVDRWPGGDNIRYGLSPHVSAFEDGEDESRVLGAGEIIFKPFMRR
ncbi:MAG: hypothetical protein ACI8PB_005278 [Desulforhopalus sp.]|jgi:hypothetical protein